MSNRRTFVVVCLLSVAILSVLAFVLVPYAESRAEASVAVVRRGGDGASAERECARGPSSERRLGVIRRVTVAGRTKGVDAERLRELVAVELCDGMTKGVADVMAVLGYAMAELSAGGSSVLVVPAGKDAYHPESGTLDLFVETDKTRHPEANGRAVLFAEGMR